MKNEPLLHPAYEHLSKDGAESETAEEINGEDLDAAGLTTHPEVLKRAIEYGKVSGDFKLADSATEAYVECANEGIKDALVEGNYERVIELSTEIIELKKTSESARADAHVALEAKSDEGPIEKEEIPKAEEDRESRLAKLPMLEPSPFKVLNDDPDARKELKEQASYLEEISNGSLITGKLTRDEVVTIYNKLKSTDSNAKYLEAFQDLILDLKRGSYSGDDWKTIKSYIDKVDGGNGKPETGITNDNLQRLAVLLLGRFQGQYDKFNSHLMNAGSTSENSKEILLLNQLLLEVESSRCRPESETIYANIEKIILMNKILKETLSEKELKQLDLTSSYELLVDIRYKNKFKGNGRPLSPKQRDLCQNLMGGIMNNLANAPREVWAKLEGKI